MTQPATNTEQRRNDDDELNACVEQMVDDYFALKESFSHDVRGAAERIYPLVIAVADEIDAALDFLEDCRNGGYRAEDVAASRRQAGCDPGASDDPRESGVGFDETRDYDYFGFGND
jgi:hypothetical protein